MSSKSNEWMRWYVGHFERDTRHLDPLEVGVYVRLINHYWCRGPIPNDPTRLAMISGLSLVRWKRLETVVLDFFQVGEDSKLHHKRLDEERGWCAKLSAKRSEAGVAGAEAKKSKKASKSAKTEKAIASDLLNDCTTEEEEEGEDVQSPSEIVVVGDATTPDDVQQAFDAWNTLAGELGLPSARTLDRQRKKKIAARLRENGGVDAWTKALTEIRESAFLRGETKEGWRAHLDFVCQPSSFRRLLEGAYKQARTSSNLPLLRPIEGGKAAPDPNDPWGIDAWCSSLPGAEPLSGPDATPERLARGKWVYGPADNRKIIDSVARQVAEKAGWHPLWRGDWSLLAEWITEGASSNHDILPNVDRISEGFRFNGNPATTLKAFDRTIKNSVAAKKRSVA